MCECESENSCDVCKYVDYVNCKIRKRMLDRLVLEFEDEILNTADASFDGKKVMCKNNSLVHFILLIVMPLLLLVDVYINCICCYMRHWIKKSIQCRSNVKMLEYDRIDVSEEIDVDEIFAIVGIFSIKALNLNRMSAMMVMI